MKKLSLAFIALTFLASCGGEEPATNTDNAPTPADTTTTAEETPAEPTIPQHRGPILGIDVSHFQGDVNWGEIKTDTMLFGYAKCTEGSGYTDPKFTENITNIRSAQLAAGGYHFYMAADDAEEQANHYLSTLGELKSGDMPPMLDLEGGGVKDDPNLDIEKFQADVILWLNTVEEKTGIQPIIYTNRPFGDKYLTNSEFAKYDLWIAEYGVEKPELPTTWADKGYTIWQRSSHAKEEGVKGNVDQDIFNGTIEEFNALLKQ